MKTSLLSVYVCGDVANGFLLWHNGCGFRDSTISLSSYVSYFSFLIENIANAMEKTIPATASRGIPLGRIGLKLVVQRMQEPMNSTAATSVSTVYRKKWPIRSIGSS